MDNIITFILGTSTQLDATTIIRIIVFMLVLDTICGIFHNVLNAKGW